MKVYLVGGAVRDKLLGLPVLERDWVVVGARAEALLKQGFKQVGKDFPVFLHPQSNEEYALARKERKSGAGYYGFHCDASPDVSLEEDLLRRDLTINAMAEDINGTIIDPYNGKRDLKERVLRHVSDAFVEDPVRVLRIARFSARLSHLGFRIAKETEALMLSMVRDGALADLVPERVWQEWQRSLCQSRPDAFVRVLRRCGGLAVIAPELDALFGIPNPRTTNCLVDSGEQALLALRKAAGTALSASQCFSALMASLGKAMTPMSSWPYHPGHEPIGVARIITLCQRLKIPNDFKTLALMVCQFHEKIQTLAVLKADEVVMILEQMDSFRRPRLFLEVLELVKVMMNKSDCRLLDDWQTLFTICATIDIQSIIKDGFVAQDIKSELHRRREVIVSLQLSQWNTYEK